MKRALFLLVAFLASCAQPPRDPNALVWTIAAEPDLLNPILSLDAYASQVEGFIFDTLLERDPKTLAFRPKIAERWELSDDHLSYVFHLRRDVRWHDGRPVTATDVVYAYDLIRDPEVEAPHLRVYYQDVQAVEALDAYTVRFTFKRPYFLALEFCAGLPILPEHLYGAGADFNRSAYNRAPVGNGPYRFLRWDTGKKIVLARNEDYYGKKPDIRKIEFKVIPDSAVALLALKKGLIDMLGLQAIQWVRQTDSPKFRARFEKHDYYTPGYQFIGWNLRDPLFADKRVREAMTSLIDRQVIIDKLQFGLGHPVSGPFFFLSPDYDETVVPLPYDPDKARSLLRAAGWEDRDGDGVLDKNGRPFRFTFLTSSASTTRERMATIVKESLRRVGIDMEIEKMEWAVFLERINKRAFQATILGWSMGYESDPYQVWHSSQTKEGSNFVGFENAEVDRLIEEARREFDAAKRHALFHRIHRIIHAEQPYTFLFSSPALIARDKRFGNVNIYRGGIDILEWTVTGN